MVEQSSDVHIEGTDEKTLVGRPVGGPAVGETRTRLADVLADVMGVENVPADAHFFESLGANSLVMAQFCARVRKREDLPSPSMKDIYRYPTINALAEGLTESAPAAPAPAPLMMPPEPVRRASGLSHTLCGTAQLLIFLGYSLVAGFATAGGYEWVATGSGVWDVYLRSLVFGGVGFVALCAFPVVAKWVLVGRWKPGEFPVWGFAYLRFWLVKALLHANPMILFIGNPLYVFYLRALGARIGKGVTILSHSVPVCTDLLTIGSGTVIRKDSFFLGYRAHAGYIQTGRITIGRDVYIGEKTVLDIDTSMGDGAQLGHSSSLHRGQSVPAGEHHHGSPAQATDVDYLRVAPARCGTGRRAWFGLASLLQLFLLYIPLGVGGLYILFNAVPAVRRRLDPEAALPLGELVTDAVVLSLVLFAGFVVLGLALLCTLPRLLHLAVPPDRVFPLYGFRYAVHRATARMTNIKFFAWLFGDSSYIVNYLRGIGYDLSHVEQTGSNFGTEVQHENPLLVTVGSGTMVADGLSVINADYSATSFTVSRATIGAHNFLGNNIAYPIGGRTGENCLLATKVMVPLDGEMREGVGLLGSPSFEIPRSVERDSRFDRFRSGDALRQSLALKNRYNLRSMAFMLFVRWLHVLALTLLGLATVELYGVVGHVVIATYMALTLALSTLYYVLLERCLTRFRRLRPMLVSIYDPAFWAQERLWKVPDRHLNIFNGTPFKALVWRLMGVRIGRRVFDDGCYMTDRTLAVIGDDCTLNAGSKVQCHSQEDGTFKSDISTLGAGCTLGVGSHVHYGVTMGDGARLAPDSFLMKGEEVPAHARWGGNPAVEMPEAAVLPAGAGRRTPPSVDSAAAASVN
ncbi:peptide synthetase [Streptomyces sp. SID2999]|uniref:Pls/PosA family non-ribosomal peptide synthetase n=1 Tax=Streptomyces sp. SID2999 TaxID=2690258 RepID=UPI00136D39EC|nr:Pls/PosA family non-ribosomal peptide synthetase [Streptomyces sp. SID2999]MYZ11193.1 peptide synthetase [Streptomyces sp. SID2999]